METLEQRIQRLIQEDVAIAPYNPEWLAMFQQEKEHLLSCLPRELIRRIEHFGSTAVPNLAAKPIVDMLVEITSLEETRSKIVPLLESQGYDYLWRPTWGEDTPPFYAWFIKRDAHGKRTHHIHMVERDFPHWERLLFRDYLIEYPDLAQEYQALKLQLSAAFPNDRVAYTKGKTDFVVRVTDAAIRFYGGQ
jgi:GrpB-like predicted nucleotidyltransferase (UPF0157 family)